MHDPRIGRFFAVDPLSGQYPHYTPYSFSGNKVIHAIELEGLEEHVLNDGSKVYGPLANQEIDKMNTPNTTNSSGLENNRTNYLLPKNSFSLSIGLNWQFNKPKTGDPSSAAVGMILGSNKNNMEYYTTAIRHPFGGKNNDLTEGNHFIHANWNLNKGKSIGLLVFKQKVRLFDQNKFNLEAPGVLELTMMKRQSLELFKSFDKVDFGFSYGVGLGSIVTQVRIPDYFDTPSASPGHKNSTTYYAGYKFQGKAGTLLFKIDASYNDFNIFTVLTLTHYMYNTLKLPIGNYNIPNYSIVGVVSGASYSFQSRKSKKD
jgi:hypothetical protein